MNQRVADALVKAHAGGLSPEDCQRLNAEDAEEVARLLIEEVGNQRAARGKAGAK